MDHKEEKKYILKNTMIIVILKQVNKKPNLYHLAHIIEILPPSTYVEWQFSTLKHILGDWRHRLSPEMLDILMIICSNGPEKADFKPEVAIDK